MWFCHFCYLLDKGFKFQPDACNGCHDVLMMPMKLSGVAILNIHEACYCCMIKGLAELKP